MFSVHYGQLYVALFRVRYKSGIEIWVKYNLGTCDLAQSHIGVVGVKNLIYGT